MTEPIDEGALQHCTLSYFPSREQDGAPTRTEGLEIRLWPAEVNDIPEDVITIDGEDSAGNRLSLVLTKDDMVALFKIANNLDNLL